MITVRNGTTRVRGALTLVRHVLCDFMDKVICTVTSCTGIRSRNVIAKREEDLLPGIIDHIVLDKILPRLLWTEFYTLSSVSRAWKKAVRSRQVFDSRVLFNSSPDTVVGYYTNRTVVLYSITHNSWHILPPITPDICQGKLGVPEYAHCTSMDGKIYVLGGWIGYRLSPEVFVFDLAAGGKWQRCANMNQRRQNFESAIYDGELYVFGGTDETSILNSEVYDPKKNTWSRIRPWTRSRYGHHVTHIGQVLCIYGGFDHHIGGDINEGADFLEAYDPLKDEWRVVHGSWHRPEGGVVFTVLGNLFSMQPDRTQRNFGLNLQVIDKYDIHENSWIRVHSFSFDALIPVGYNWFPLPDLTAILAVGDELIALLICFSRRRGGERVLCVFESTGFSSSNQKISWKLKAFTFKQPIKRQLERKHYFVQML